MNNKDLVTLYESGLTIKEISDRTKIGYEAVRKILKQENVKWRKNYMSDFTPDQLQSMLDKHDKGMSVKEIADWYEISSSPIVKWLKANKREVICSMRKYDILRQTPLNSIQKQILVGKLLGDGCLYKDTAKQSYKLSFGHCKKQEQYFHWNVTMWDPFINNYRENVDKRGNSIMLQTTTICHQDFNQFGKMFYQGKIKSIPKNLDMYFTPLALAVWIQDDGNLNEGVNMRICSMGFTKKDNEDLVDYLKRCFNLDATVAPYKYKGVGYWMIALNKINTQKLSDIIRPHVVESMKYKLMPESSTTSTPNILEEISSNNDDTV